MPEGPLIARDNINQTVTWENENNQYCETLSYANAVDIHNSGDLNHRKESLCDFVFVYKSHS